MKYLFRRDTILATLAVFIVMGSIALLPLNLSVLNPFKLALADFDFNDIAYSELNKNADMPLDPRIVVVNIDNADRGQIAAMIETVQADKPSAIGLDVLFEEPKDPFTDSLLYSTIKNSPQLVMASRLVWADEKQPYKTGFLTDTSLQYGFANFVGTDKGTIRYFSPMENEDGKKWLSFSTAIIKNSDKAAYQELISRHKKVELINYSRRPDKYIIVDGLDILDNNVAQDFFKNKIVLIGYISKSPNDIEDKYLTPMNAKFAGKAVPDMNGVIIHANIISMVLDGSFVKKIPSWLNWIITILLAWVHISLFIRYYIDHHIWFHLVAKIAQLISAIFVVYLSIYLFDKYNLKLNMSVAIVAIILAIDIIYFYEAFALWLHKKFHFKTIFHKNHH